MTVEIIWRKLAHSPGWLRSRLARILTTAFAVISVCMITYAIGTVISLFM